MRSISYYGLVFFWIYCFTTCDVAGQTEDLIRHYTMKDGLPAEGINRMIQDRHGFVWLATYSGLTKFDGYKFTTYRNHPHSINSLANNWVSSLWEDGLGRLWIGHEEGLDIFDPQTEQFSFHWPASVEGKRKSDIAVLKLRGRTDGKVWICTTNGVYVGSPQTTSIEKFPKLPRDGLWVWDIAEMQDGSVWAAAGEYGVYHVDAKTGETKHYGLNPNNSFKGLPGHAARSALTDKQDRVWIGSQSGLQLFSPKDKSFIEYLEGVRVLDLFEDSDGKLLIGAGNGYYTFDPETGRSDKHTEHGEASVIKDKQGITWVASMKGLEKINPKNRKFSLLNEFGKGASIVEDNEQAVWILRFNGGKPSLLRFDSSLRKLNEYVHNPQDPHSFSGRVVRSVFRDRQGSIWLTSERKLEKFNPDDQTFSSVDLNVWQDPISSYCDSRGTIWLGGWATLHKYDPTTNTYKQIRSSPEAGVYSFVEDRNQNLWIASDDGLIRYDLDTDSLVVFRNDPPDPQSLSNNSVFSVAKDKNGTIWIGTGGGLNKIIPGTEGTTPKFDNWRTVNSGLPNDDVFCVIDEGDGTLWMACGNMISHFSPDQNTFRNYDFSDGLSGKAFRGSRHAVGKGIRTNNGRIYFGTPDGLVVFHPDSLADNPFIPPVYITEFSIQNQTVPIKGTHADTLTWKTPLKKNIQFEREIILKHNQNDFNLEFAALDYTNPEGNLYKYKLEPYEKNWTETNAENRFARYTNINPGNYTFRVIASNNDRVWNEQGTSLSIIIIPPWWQTWWAYTLYGFAFLAILLLWRNYDINRVKLKHRAEHLTELNQLKTRFFTNISHEFRTPITLVLGPLQDLYTGKTMQDPKAVLGPVIRNGQRLLRLINQLLDLSKIEAGKMHLHATPTDALEFFRGIAASYESLAVQKKIKYVFYPEVNELLVYIDREKMEKVVHNLLSNAFKFTKPGGEVILNLKTEKDHCLITVKDTGIGIPADQLDKVFDRFYQVDASQIREYEGSGLGMALAKELVELHKGKISVRSTEGKGTIFTFMLPLGKEHLNQEEISGPVHETKTLSDVVIISDDGEGENKENLRDAHLPVLLIVEDNADMRNYIRKVLSDDYRILEAENGKNAANVAQEKVPDLIISDIMMPQMDGYKLCSVIKTNKITSHIPVILLTAKADRESKLSGLELGADDYVSKPFDAEELRLVVRNRIEARRKMRERFSREITLEPRQIAITSMDEKFLTNVLSIVDQHMSDEHFSVEALSSAAGFSNMHFYRKIKALSGQTPSQFLRTIRLKRAAELLAKNSDNVTQIAYAVGFSSLSYFNKCFKETFAMTPREYLKKAPNRDPSTTLLDLESE